jgi:hypothetical protein
MAIYLPAPLVYLFVGGALCISAVVVWGFGLQLTEKLEGKASGSAAAGFVMLVYALFYGVGWLVLAPH